MLFNLYTNDQPTLRDTKHFLYADDLAITVQDTTFDDVEKKLTNTLKVMTNYYDNKQLKPTQTKHGYVASTYETVMPRNTLYRMAGENAAQHRLPRVS